MNTIHIVNKGEGVSKDLQVFLPDGAQLKGIYSIQIDGMDGPHNVLSATLKVWAPKFDISILPENVTVIVNDPKEVANEVARQAKMHEEELP